jgi:hypothetical protein
VSLFWCIIVDKTNFLQGYVAIPPGADVCGIILLHVLAQPDSHRACPTALTGLMCRDDGSPISLLSGPIVLPPSPYSRPTPGHPATFPADTNSVCNV